ncbi:hypothetical protein CV102_08480 [Natronococcus pandeyae]|uniref:Nucleotide-diphospho-sugar transferase domain-containing protein n=1 Tax=Natronococcus pandeyae TaxID=2055836 RepID=A0A8J8Q647_9EURY|nr:putative nucleotide-diphospho-sugar transferase [Natronococcus pandeyae]TYL39303.1 hypothetical protein CV102_08480 [Natronococcus pandeyae]
MSSPTEGVVYIATGRDYIQEAALSAKSLKEHNPDIHTTIFSDVSFDAPFFDDVRPLEDPSYDFGDSVISPEMAPYDRTLFLDTDTYVCENLSEMFDILDRFDIAAAHNPGSRTAVHDDYEARDVPKAFPQYNTGVLLFNDNSSTRAFFESWSDIYEENREQTIAGLNQPAFREALYKSDLQIGTLPSEYNLRVRYEGSVGFMTDSVKIAHGRHPAGLPAVAERLNADDGMRVYSFRKWPVEMITKDPSYRYYVRTLLTEETKPYTFRGRFYASIKERGLRDTASRIARDLKKASPFS